MHTFLTRPAVDVLGTAELSRLRTCGHAQFYSRGRQGTSENRPYQLSFCEQVLACTESATSQYSTMSRCLIVLQCVAVCCSVLQCVAVCCSVLQCVAVCCCVLQCVGVCCSALQGRLGRVKFVLHDDDDCFDCHSWRT